MPRPKAEILGYSGHFSREAHVRINRKAIYLGKYGTTESFAKYHL